MIPGYRYGDPYYQTFPQREPNSYACQYYPSWDHVMPHMKADPSKQQPVFMQPLFNNNISPPYPGDHGGCCHHSSPGYYNFRPPFSPVQPPPQPYYYGPYPPYPGPYPGYFIPHPHYSVDQARYDYDKAQDHCYGCPNHKCYRGDEKLPKIEEQKPEKTQDGESTGLIRLPNCPPPVVWVPASSIKDKDGDKSAKLKPGFWNGWVPLDISNLKGSREEEGERKVQQVDDKSAQTQSPFPLIWLPGYKEPEEEVKDLKEITPSKFKIVPLKLLENDDHGERPSGVVQEDPEPENQVEEKAPEEKQTKIKTIPVKQVEDTSQKKTSLPEKDERKVDQNKKTIHEKNKDESDVDKASEKKQSAPEKKQSSPVRSSKLPPVCLRVDPLPRKMRTKGTSRSPSPPGHKDKRDHQTNEEHSPRIARKEDIFEKVIPIVNVKDNTLSRAEKEQKFKGSVPVATMEVSSKESEVHGTAKELTEGSTPVEKDSEERKFENKEVKEKKELERDLSETDAAVIIQSAYRGFEVRRWHPLEKLRKIAKIREHVNNVKRQVESVEASQKEQDAQHRMVLGETIMNLLLDTVQGLHPSVREERKTIARELICLQDKLDSLHSRMAEGQVSAKVEEETKAAIDSGAAFTRSSADATEESFKQDSLAYLIDTASAETTECPAQEVTRLTADDMAVFVSSLSDATEEPRKLDSLEGMVDNASIEATEGPAQADVNLIDSSFTNEVISDTGLSLPSESNLEQESMLPREDGTMKDQASFGSDDEAAIAPPPSIEASVEQDVLENVKENSASENLSLQCKERESKFECVIVGAEVTEIDKCIDLPGNVGSCGRDESTGTPICNEEYSKLPSEDASLGLDVSGLLEPSKEVECQEHEAAPNDVDNHGADGCANVLGRAEELWQALDREHVIAKEIESERKSAKKEETHDRQEIFLSPLGDESDGINISIPVKNVDVACNKDVFCPQLAIEVDDASPAKEDNIISQDSLRSEKTDANDNRLEVYGEKVQGIITEMHIPVVKDVLNELSDSSAAGQDLHVSVGNSSSSSSTGAADPRGEVKDANQVKADAAVDVVGRRLMEENEKLRKMLSELLEAGKEQLGVITILNGRVQDLERKLAQKRKRAIKVKRNRPLQLDKSVQPPPCEDSS